MAALVSPWTYTTTDVNGKTLSVRLVFDNLTFILLAATAHKDPGCLYSRFYFGLGADGTPDTAATQMAIADGDSVVAVPLLNGFGFTTINHALAVQATAGP
jgi:hypothetical protein